MVSSDPIWTRLQSAGLANKSQAKSMRADFERENPANGQSRADGPILDWLVTKKCITGYQKTILASGLDGPFVHDDYLIGSRIDTGPLAGSFLAIHRISAHPVRLFFCGGADESAARMWQRSSQLVADWSVVRHPFVWTLFESVVTPEYRLIVASQGTGKTMLEKVPRKGRLPWLQVCQSMEQMALGLQSIHEQGLVHGRLSPAFVWLQKTGVCQIIPPLDHVITQLPPENDRDKLENPARYASPRLVESNTTATSGDDLFSLGQIAIRLITGTVPRLKTTRAEQRQKEIEPLERLLSKYDVPIGLNELVRGLLMADVAEAPLMTNAVIAFLKNILAGQSTVADVEPEPKSLATFVSSIEQRSAAQRSSDGEIPNDSVNEPEEDAGADVEFAGSRIRSRVEIGLAKLNTNPAIFSTGQRVSGRRRTSSKSSRLPWIFGASILTTAVVIGLVLSNPAGKTRSNNPVDPNDHLTAQGPDTPTDRGDEKDPVVAVAPRQPVSSQWLQQTVVNSMDAPWESPTAGRPLDVTRIPAAPDFLFAWHPARMVNDPSRNRILQALGPDFQKLIESWKSITGVPIEQVDRMLVSLHPAQGNYEVFIHARLLSTMDRQLFLASAGDLEPATSPGENLELYRSSRAGICLLLNPDDPNQVTELLMGTGTTLDDSFVSGGLAACDRNLAELISRSDQDRDASVLFLNSALISEEGAKLFGGAFARIRRPLQLFFREHVRAVMFSVHNDRGSYLELMTEQTVDLEDKEMAEDLQVRLAAIETQIAGELNDVTDLPYWDRLQKRFVPMLAELVRGTRVGNERDGVIANCWLPPSALHNLIAASELAISLGQVQGTAVVLESGPQSMIELLETRRTLKVTNSPDLRILLEDLQSEILADYPDIPFAFAIKLRGDDLQADGITQNQRPGTIDLVDKSLSEILTRIMVQANPDKDATGPNDPKCKLIWVVAPDPDDPQQQAILITTRAAAKTHQYELPPAFRE